MNTTMDAKKCSTNLQWEALDKTYKQLTDIHCRYSDIASQIKLKITMVKDIDKIKLNYEGTRQNLDFTSAESFVEQVKLVHELGIALIGSLNDSIHYYRQETNTLKDKEKIITLFVCYRAVVFRALESLHRVFPDLPTFFPKM